MWVIFTSLLWMGLGYLLSTQKLPQILSQGLYWIGIPLQILALARRADFSQSLWLPILITMLALVLGIWLALVSLEVLRWLVSYNYDLAKLHPQLQLPGSEYHAIIHLPLSNIIPQHRPGQGSFILASMMSNAGYMGLAIAPAFVDQSYWSWIAIYHIINNLLGFFTLGILLASYFGQSQQHSVRMLPLKIFAVPALWAFLIGWFTRGMYLPEFIETGLQDSRWVVNFSAFLLTGLQLSQLRKLSCLKRAVIPSILKVILLPALIGIGLSLLGFAGDGCFSMVLMAGTPTAFTAIILAEKFNLDRQIIANSILLSTLIFPLIIPAWVVLFK